jgi:hypothetical protein
MKTYQCHKRVRAAKIVAITPIEHGDEYQILMDGHVAVNAPKEWFDKHKPKIGGYFVQYEDGYQSFSPAKAFEDGYTEIPSALQPAKPAELAFGDAIEQEIQAKGKTAPRITPADVEANIVQENYFTAAEGVLGATMEKGRHFGPGSVTEHTLLTFCVLVLKNGFTVTGESACASPENFDAEIGRRIARENAINKVWPLMGYALRSRLAGI